MNSFFFNFYSFETDEQYATFNYLLSDVYYRTFVFLGAATISSKKSFNFFMTAFARDLYVFF